MSLSLDYLNKLGWTCQIVEKWIPGANVRQDAFGFGDILAYHMTSGICLVQTTTWGNFNARKAKIDVSPHKPLWKCAGGRILLHGWGDKGLKEEEL
jgi:hypothetical protein